MKCYHTYDHKTKQKVLIPQCMSVAHSNDIEDCVCITNIEYLHNKEEHTREIQRLQESNKRLVHEIDRLTKLLIKKE